MRSWPARPGPSARCWMPRPPTPGRSGRDHLRVLAAQAGIPGRRAGLNPGSHLPRAARHCRRRTVMTGLLRAEPLRLATTRSYWLLAAGAVALIAAGTSATAATSFASGTSPARTTLAIAGLAQTVALLAGALSVTGEFRHKTITPA